MAAACLFALAACGQEKDVEAPAERSELKVPPPTQEEQFGEVWYGFYTK